MNLANKMLHRKSKTQHNTYDPDSVKQISKVDQAIHITLCKPAYAAVKNRKKITLTSQKSSCLWCEEAYYNQGRTRGLCV